MGEVVVQDAMVFSSTTAIASPLLAVNVGMVVLMLAIMVAIIVNEESLPAVRLVSTGAPPALAFEPGQQWHLFLSHIVRCRPRPPLSSPRSQLLVPRPSDALCQFAACDCGSGPRGRTPTRRSSGSCSGCSSASTSSSSEGSRIQPTFCIPPLASASPVVVASITLPLSIAASTT